MNFTASKLHVDYEGCRREGFELNSTIWGSWVHFPRHAHMSSAVCLLKKHRHQVIRLFFFLLVGVCVCVTKVLCLMKRQTKRKYVQVNFKQLITAALFFAPSPCFLVSATGDVKGQYAGCMCTFMALCKLAFDAIAHGHCNQNSRNYLRSTWGLATSSVLSFKALGNVN